MRVAREKITTGGCYYHLMNRVGGQKDYLPFDDVDREYGMNLVRRLSEYYLLEFISMCWMGNHFHIVLYAPGSEELPDSAIIAARHNMFYGKNNPKCVDPADKESCEKIGKKMIDISSFMKDFQQRFVVKFNRSRDRRGHLWGDRFKSTILEGREALWSAVKYVELNPVRAALVAEPANYRHSTWGWYSGSGTHPFESSFVKHMRKALGELKYELTPSELFSKFAGELARTIAYESKCFSDEISERVKKAERGETMPVKFLRRTRHWSDGGIIGSKAFIREVATQFRDESKVLQKRFSHGTQENGSALYCFKMLRTIS